MSDSTVKCVTDPQKRNQSSFLDAKFSHQIAQERFAAHHTKRCFAPSFVIGDNVSPIRNVLPKSFSRTIPLKNAVFYNMVLLLVHSR